MDFTALEIMMVVDRVSGCSRWQRHKWQRCLRNKTKMNTWTLNTTASEEHSKYISQLARH
jgi:hypothetical protein